MIDGQAMKISITGHQTDVGEPLSEHVESHLESSVSKYFADAHETHVTFSRDGHAFHAHVSIHVGHDIHAEGRASDQDPYAAFNAASEHAEKQLRRSKRKLREHH